jgi:hypothetical protein
MRFNCNERQRRGNGYDTVTVDIDRMNWLFPRLRDPQGPAAAEARSRRDDLPPLPDPYHGAALGVECAWPLVAEREVVRALS